MIKGTTSTGFEYEIKDESLDDWELFEAFSDVENDNPLAVIEIAKRLFGDEQYKRLKDFVRGENGRVSLTAMNDTIMEVFNANQEIKN